MNFKKTFLPICLIIAFLVMAGICAADLNQAYFDSNFKYDSECCSFVIQEDYETVFAFRQDAPVGDDGVSIHNDTLGDLEVIVQEVDYPGSHFIHAIVTEDGWIVGHGGDSSNVTDTLALEKIASKMLVSKNISSDSLSKIQKIFRKYNYSHFIIKAPDGSYAAVYSENYTFGTLNPGEYLVLPNEYSGFRDGNYTEYSTDPIDAIIDICSHEDSGWNRRNVYTYDYKLHDVADGQKYGVDVYVTNDNGHDVGLNTSEIVTYCYFNGNYYPNSTIPQNPDKLCIGNYIFENQTSDPSLELVRGFKEVLFNNTLNQSKKIRN